MRRAQGLSLIEVVVAAALLGLIVTLLWGLMVGSTTGYARDSARQMMQDNARRVLDEIAQELRDADAATMSLAKGASSTSFTFNKIVGYTPGDNTVTPAIPAGPVLSSAITYGYEAGSIYVPHLKINEGRIYRSGPTAMKTAGVAWQGAAEKTRLCEYIKAATTTPAYSGGFLASRADDRVTISLTLRTFDEHLNELTTTLSTTITMRISTVP